MAVSPGAHVVCNNLLTLSGIYIFKRCYAYANNINLFIKNSDIYKYDTREKVGYEV